MPRGPQHPVGLRPPWTPLDITPASLTPYQISLNGRMDSLFHPVGGSGTRVELDPDASALGSPPSSDETSAHTCLTEDSHLLLLSVE